MLENRLNISQLKEYPQSAFLNRFFKLLSDHREAYCVLRNHSGLPNSLEGSDLDIAVGAGRGKEVIMIASQAAKECGGGPIISYSGSLHVLRLIGSLNGVSWGVALDVFDEITYKGIHYLSTSTLIDKAFKYNSVHVAMNEDALVLALLKELLSNGRDRKGYLAKVTGIYKESTARFDFLDQDIADVLRELCSEEELTKEEIFNYSVKLRKVVLRGKGFKGYADRLRNLLLRAKRIVRPAGMTVAVLGTDGSGKTTLINGVTPVLEEAVHQSVYYRHLRPHWLPALGAAKRKRETDTAQVNDDPHGGKSSNAVVSLLRLAYYSIDYTLGYWVKIHPKLIVRPKVCMFDRYYYDFIFDPKRMKIDLPQWVLKTAFVLTPKPSVVLCLVGDPQLIYQRKPETNIESVTEHIEYLERLAKNKNAFRVDTTQSYDDALAEVIAAFSHHSNA